MSTTEVSSESTATFDPAEHPNRLNLGCGYDKRDGYLNVDFMDFHAPDLVADVRHLHALPSNRYVEVLAMDCLEHLPRPETDMALQEWARLLAPGGVLRIRTSNVLGLASLLKASTNVERHAWLIQSLFGTQAYPGDFHTTGFTDLTLIDHLARAGLTRIVLQDRDQWLFDAEAVKPDGRVDNAVAVSWGEGCYGLEGDENFSWRWFDRIAEITVVNTFSSEMEVVLRAKAQTGHRRPSHLVVEAGLERRSLRVSAAEQALEARFRLQPGPTVIRMSTDAPQVAAPQDERRLYFRLIEPSLTPS